VTVALQTEHGVLGEHPVLSQAFYGNSLICPGLPGTAPRSFLRPLPGPSRCGARLTKEG
jgi:hypothetical protein